MSSFTWAMVLILQSYNSFLLVPASPLLCCQAAECFAESWAAWQGYVGGRSQIDQSFQLQPKAATIIKLGLDHVVVIHKAHNREIEASTQAGKQTLLTHPSSSSLTLSLSPSLHSAVTVSSFFFFFLHLSVSPSLRSLMYLSSFPQPLSLEAVTGAGFQPLSPSLATHSLFL